MENIVGDLTNIYLACIDGYKARWRQTIDDKYQAMDKCLLASYLYILVLENREMNNEASTQALVNYLMRQVIHSEVGNIQYETKDAEKMQTFRDVLERVVNERFKYLNSKLKVLTYPYVSTAQNDYTKLLQFLENIADYAILKKIILRGNKEAVNTYTEKCDCIKEQLYILSTGDMFYVEKKELIELIKNGEFEDSRYGKLLSVVLNLKDVRRCSLTYSRFDENVLFHQFAVAITSVCLAIYANNNLKENFNIYKIVATALFHDFGEYTGTEITSHIKKYNETTKKMFAEIEEANEEDLRKKLGNKLYVYIKAMKKNEPESYVCELMDKILPFINSMIEANYYSNYVFIRHALFLNTKRLQIFKRIDDIDGISNKSFFKNLLIQEYIFLKDEILNANAKIRSRYFTEDEINKMNDEIKTLRENPESFWS